MQYKRYIVISITETNRVSIETFLCMYSFRSRSRNWSYHFQFAWIILSFDKSDICASFQIISFFTIRSLYYCFLFTFTTKKNAWHWMKLNKLLKLLALHKSWLCCFMFLSIFVSFLCYLLLVSHDLYEKTQIDWIDGRNDTYSQENGWRNG